MLPDIVPAEISCDLHGFGTTMYCASCDFLYHVSTVSTTIDIIIDGKYSVWVEVAKNEKAGATKKICEAGL